MTHDDLRTVVRDSRLVQFLLLFALTGAGFARNLSARLLKQRESRAGNNARIAPAGGGRVYFILTLVLLAVIPAVILPGDAPFINDDAWLLLNALGANDAGALATAGLMGTKGVRYGPLPTWIYQLMLLVTHDPVVLVLLHAVLLAGSIALAVYAVARVTKLYPWFAAVLVVSPYLWFYDRLLWDNSFNLALTALALSSYGAFLSHRSRIALTATVVLLFAAVLVHTMSIAFVVPMAAHMAIFERRALWRNKWLLLPVLLLLVGLSWEYWRDFARGPVQSGFDQAEPFYQSFLFALTGARLLGATGLGYFVGEGWEAGNPIVVPVVISSLLFPFAWAGICLAAVRIIQAIRRRSAEVLDHLAGIALATVAIQSLLDGFAHASGHPHYHNATWIAHALLAWIAFDALAKLRVPLGRIIARNTAVLLVVALTTVTVWMLITLHASGGARTIHYGTTLSNQLEVISDTGRYSQDTPVLTDVPQFELFPQALGVLRILAPPPPSPAIAARTLLIRYRSIDPSDAHVEVVAR